ncbi:uncharacterized protein LOC142984057 [Anticarsia gemmatalis]|uniref:uncharacterized protein LOC142984057 n=1 Tax=Anticarsia gemmatalis TaxID=129554 RepID=UPI003F774501
MKILCVILIYALFLTLAENVQGTSQVDLVIQGLKNQEWSAKESECFKQTMFILDNVKNYTVWAMWIWNSMQYPVGTFLGTRYNLGHYDQCLQALDIAGDLKIEMQYCLADIQLTSQRLKKETGDVMGATETYLAIPTKMKRDLSKIISGTCVPSVCKPRSVVKILNALYKVNPITPAELTIAINHCDAAGVTKEFSTGFFVYVTFILALVSTAVISTFYVQRANPKSTITQMASSFCLKRNWSTLTKRSTDEISQMNVFKVLIAVGAVFLHGVYFRANGPVSNMNDLEQASIHTYYYLY